MVEGLFLFLLSPAPFWADGGFLHQTSVGIVGVVRGFSEAASPGQLVSLIVATGFLKVNYRADCPGFLYPGIVVVGLFPPSSFPQPLAPFGQPVPPKVVGKGSSVKQPGLSLLDRKTGQVSFPIIGVPGNYPVSALYSGQPASRRIGIAGHTCRPSPS